MTRGEMRNLLRQRMGATFSATTPQKRLDQELNFAAQSVALKLAKNPYVDATRKTYVVNTDGNVDYPLLGADDLHQVIAAQGTSREHGIRLVAEWEWEEIVDRFPEGVDDKGKYLAYLTYDAGDAYKITLDASVTTWTMTVLGATTNNVAGDQNATAVQVQTALTDLSKLDSSDVVVTGSDGGPYTIRFHERMGFLDSPLIATPATGTITVERYHHTLRYVAKPPVLVHTLIYCIRIPEIPEGLAKDDWTYSAIPPEYHELIIERALVSVLGHDGSPIVQFAGAVLADLLGTGTTQAATRPAQDPYRPKT